MFFGKNGDQFYHYKIHFVSEHPGVISFDHLKMKMNSNLTHLY